MKTVKFGEDTMIFADIGKILTDGTSYGEAFSLAVDRNPNEYYEILEEEYQQIMERELDSIK